MAVFIAPLLWLLDLFRGRQQQRRRLLVLAHRGFFVGESQEQLFVKVTNLSDTREVEITHIWFETEPQLDLINSAQPLPARLRMDETFETWVPMAELPEAVALERRARVRLSNGKTVKSRLNTDVRPIGSVARAGTFVAHIRTDNMPGVTAVPPLSGSSPRTAFTAGWRHTTNGIEAAPLGNLANTAMPGLLPGQDQAPFLRVGAVIGCQPMPVGTSSSEVGSHFLNFLASGPVAALVAMTTSVDPTASWSRMAGNGALRLDAVLGDEKRSPPIASAMLLPPATGLMFHGLPDGVACLWLHVEPRSREGQQAAPAPLTEWFHRFEHAISIAAAFADFLHTSLDLTTCDQPNAKVGVIMQAPRSMAELVDPEGIPVLPGASVSGHFIAYAIADRGGRRPRAAARDMLAQLCDHTMHLTGFESVIDSFAGSDHD